MTLRIRLLLLLFGLVASFAYLYQQNVSIFYPPPPGSPPVARKILNLDPDTKLEIESLIGDIKIPDKENTIRYATKLDHGIGRKALRHRNYQEAYEVYQKVLAISYDRGSLMGISIALGSMSDILNSMNEDAEALSLGTLSYKIVKKMNKPTEDGVAEIRLARLLEDQDRAMAMMVRLRARENLEGTRYKHDYVAILNALAADSYWLGDYDQSFKTIIESWDLVSGYGHSADMARVRAEAALQLAKLYRKKGEFEQAVEALEQSLLDYSSDRKGTDWHQALLYELGRNYAASGKVDQAKRHFRIAYSYYENNRAKAVGDWARAKQDDDNIELVNRLIEILIQEQDYPAAMALLETNKARTLSDIGANVYQKEIYQQLNDLEQEHARQRVALMEKTLPASDASLDDEMDSLLGVNDHSGSKIWEEFEALADLQRKELRNLNLELQLANVAVSEPLDSKAIKLIQTNLAEDEAVVSLFASDTQLQMFVMTHGDIQHTSSNMPYASYRREVDKLRTALLNPHFDFYTTPAQKLASGIIEPLMRFIPDRITKLIYSPDGMFSRLPFAVLPVGSRFAAERFQITRVPSLQLYQAGEDPVRVSHGISCVDPEIYGQRLPFQQETGKQLAVLFNNLDHYSGSDCTAETLEQAIAGTKQPSFLHIGAHGRFYPDDAMQSSFFFAKDGEVEFWSAQRIASNDLSHFKLVTLSSCEAGLTNLDNKRDVFGIIRALKFGGANNILAPLWQVQDQATSQLIQSFYEAYAGGMSASKALQSAQQKMIGSDSYSHPFYWAGFVLTGGSS